MNPDKDDELDAVIREWAVRHAAADGNLDDLVERVHQRLSEPAVEMAPHHAPSRSLPRTVAWLAGAALAASVALVMYVNRLPNSILAPTANDSQSSAAGKTDVASYAPFGPLDAADKQLLAHELQQEFDGRFAWIMESGGETKLGLKPAENVGSKKVVAVRFVVESRGRDDREWKPLRVLDFLALTEEIVRTSPSSSNGSSVEFWTYVTPDGLIAVDADFDLNGSTPVRVSSSRLMTAGAPAEIWQEERDGAQYRLYQAAELVDQERMG